jgi:hypothetical protein
MASQTPNTALREYSYRLSARLLSHVVQRHSQQHQQHQQQTQQQQQQQQQREDGLSNAMSNVASNTASDKASTDDISNKRIRSPLSFVHSIPCAAAYLVGAREGRLVQAFASRMGAEDGERPTYVCVYVLNRLFSGRQGRGREREMWREEREGVK